MITNATDETIKTKFGFLPTSVWHITKTQNLLRFVNDNFGNNSYAEGTNLSQFNPDVATRIIKLWSNEHDKILDPFAGRCRALISMQLNRQYTGFEISPKVCLQLNNNLNRNTLNNYVYTPTINNKDSRLINYFNEYDLIFSCPPYWDVEDYNILYNETINGQLSDLHNYNEFLIAYKQIISNCYNALKPNKYCVLVVNDIRRDKRLIHFGFDTIKLAEEVGFVLHDIIINQLNSLAIMGVASAIENGYVPKMHEYILVFKKYKSGD